MSARERAAVVQSVISGALTVREACERHDLSTQCVVGWVTEFRQASLDAFDARLRQTLESQGLAAPIEIAAPHFVVARGELALPDLIQIMALGRRSGVITVSHDGTESRLWCAEGDVIDAESGKLQGLAAVYRVLAVDHGRITTSFSTEVSRPARVRRSTMELLLEGARRADECKVAQRALGDGCYRLAPDLPAHDLGLAEAERALLAAFALPRPVASVLEESVLGDLETLSHIKTWVSSGYLVADAGVEHVRAPLPAPPVSHTPQVLSVMSGAAQARHEPSPILRTLLLGAVAGLGLGLGVWSSLPKRTGAPPSEPAAAAAAAPSALPAATALSVPAANGPPETNAPPEANVRRTAPPPRTSSADQPTPRLDTSAIARATPTFLSRPRPHALTRSRPRAEELDRPTTSPATLAAPVPGDPIEPGGAIEATRDVPRMRIIEERVPKLRLVE